jgi:transposase-like protein
MAKQKDSSKAVVLSTYDLMRKYPTEESAVEYLMPILWPEGPFCPYCGSKNHRSRRKLATFFCSDCRQDFTIRTNTIFHRSHIPLNKWLFAMYIIVTARKGISSLQLSKEIGVTQKSA